MPPWWVVGYPVLMLIVLVWDRRTIDRCDADLATLILARHSTLAGPGRGVLHALHTAHAQALPGDVFIPICVLEKDISRIHGHII